ncbi:MAG: PaaI family thioesterase [Acidimicrobiales bacterium]
MTTGTGPPTAETIEALLRQDLPLYEYIGLKVERIGEVLECGVPLTASNSNHVGGMHAAVQWASAEVLGGVAYLAHPEFGDCWAAVREVTIAFTKVARTGIHARAAFASSQVADVCKRLDAEGKAEFSLDVVVEDATGEVVGTAVGRYYLRRQNK